MTRILGIVGSPRKNGNTHVLISRILEGAEHAGALTSLTLLGEIRIKECDGCHACWQTGSCNKQDDMIDLYPRIADHDILIFGTPVYWYGPTALMKAFLDRFVYFNGPNTRPQITDKRGVLVVPFEETSEETAEPLVQLFEKSMAYLNIPLIRQLLVPGVTQQGEVKKNDALMTQAFTLGTELAVS